MEEEGEILLTFTINDRFYSVEEQVRMFSEVTGPFLEMSLVSIKVKILIYCLPKQYVIYDFNTFMADWGGYMGLALGYRELRNLSDNN